MKTLSRVCLIAAALLLGQQFTAAQTAKFRFLAAIYADDKGGGFNQPEGVACGASGQIVVSDTGNDRLVRFTFADKTVSGGSPIQIPQLAAPTRIYFGAKGDIYALNTKERRVAHLSAAGEFKDMVSFDGTPPPATIVPRDFAMDSADNLYVLDVFSSRMLVVSPQGKFQRALPLPADMGAGPQITVDDTGTVVVLDTVQRRLYSAAKDATAFAPVGGSLSEAVGTMPTFITMSKGTTFVLEGIGGRIVSLRRDCTFISRQLTAGREEGQLDHPAQMCINDKDEAFVADRDNSRIQIFQLIR
jgi:hypothetical protein